MTQKDDYNAIRNLLSDYCFAIDSFDPEGVGALFTEDALITGLFGEQRGRAEITGKIRGAGERLLNGRHLILNASLTIEGETARGRSYLVALGVSETEPPAIRTTSVYVDGFRKENGRWLIARREILKTPAEAVNPDRRR